MLCCLYRIYSIHLILFLAHMFNHKLSFLCCQATQTFIINGSLFRRDVPQLSTLAVPRSQDSKCHFGSLHMVHLS